MNTRSPYGPMVQQQREPMAGAQVQARPMQYQRPQPAPAQQPKSNALGGMLGKAGGGGGSMSMGMGSAMSDERSKREIEQLESANEALTKALSSKAEYPDTTARSSGMQALGQQAVPPSSASFPDAPADAVAERVAAQNAAMQQTSGAQPPQQAGGFGFKPSMPNMADLDEAYARMGQGG